MNSYIYIKPLLLLLCCLLILQACKKTEFMPEPIGEAIPAPNYPKLADALNSQDYSLFITAWKRADMETILNKERTQGKFTFLVPDNQAMETAGYTASVIAKTAPEVLEKLLRYHVLSDQVSLAQLSAVPTDLQLNTMLTHPKFMEGSKLEAAALVTVPYRYQHALIAKGTDVFDNGKPIKVIKEISVDAGQVIVINQVLQIPEKQMIDVLEEDGRFTLFLKAMELNDVEYQKDIALNRSASYSPNYRFIVDWDYFAEGTFHTNNFQRHIIRSTLFAPTNEAFHQLGIYNENDLRAINNRTPNPRNRYNKKCTPLDSLLQMQLIADARNRFDTKDNVRAITILRVVSSNSVVFYSHALTNKLLDNYIIRTRYVDSLVNDYLDYNFSLDASNQVTVSQKDSKTPPATIIEPNINTIQGPIHVVNRLIVPKNFTMWHKK